MKISLILALAISVLPTPSALAQGSCWDYDLENGGSGSSGGFASMKDKSIFAGKSGGGGGGGNPNGVAYSNLGTQDESDEAPMKGALGGPIKKNGSAGGGQWGNERYVKQTNPNLWDVQKGRLENAFAAGWAGIEPDNMDGCSQSGANILACQETVKGWNELCELTQALGQKHGRKGICVVKNSLEMLKQISPGKVDKLIVEIEKENRDEYKQYMQAVGDPKKMHVVFYGSMEEAKGICSEAASQGFKVIVNSDKDQKLSKANNKCCGG